VDELAEARSMGSIATAVLAVVALVLSGGALITSVARDGGGAVPQPPRAASAAAEPASVAVELSEFAISPTASPSPRAGPSR
jgi:hypothetical protein